LHTFLSVANRQMFSGLSSNYTDHASVISRFACISKYMRHYFDFEILKAARKGGFSQ